MQAGFQHLKEDPHTKEQVVQLQERSCLFPLSPEASTCIGINEPPRDLFFIQTQISIHLCTWAFPQFLGAQHQNFLQVSRSDNWVLDQGFIFSSHSILTGFVSCNYYVPSLDLQFCPESGTLLSMDKSLGETRLPAWILNSFPAPDSVTPCYLLRNSI